MRGEPKRLSPITVDTQKSDHMNSEPTYFDDYSDETDSNGDLNWSPGDGICPSTAEFNHCCQSKYDDWSRASSTHWEALNTVQSHLNAFLNLHEDVPPFHHSPPKDVDIQGKPKSFLSLRSSLRVRTTQDSDCSHPQKSIEYIQFIGSPKPAIYKEKSETELQVTLPIHTKPFYSGHFTSIVLAWSYIISCRWVEILQQNGWECTIVHRKDIQIEDSFWDIITQGSWRASVRKGEGTFFSPWMLISESTKNTWDDQVPVLPNPPLAFEILLDFCVSEGLEYELLTSLALILLLTSRDVPTPSLTPPRTPTSSATHEPLQTRKIFYHLLNIIDKCITLSSTLDALDSLVCSVFFDPSVPCNLMGAASLGVKSAVSTANEIDNRKLLQAISYAQPRLSLFWAAIVCVDLVTPYLNMAFYSLPPICLPAGFWTKTIQSFLQAPYHLNGSNKAVISRVREFQTSFYCRSGISVPWSPSPPFGQTLIENVSLEVRSHLGHMHTPLSWMACWVLKCGEEVPATKQYPVHHVPIHRMYQPGLIANSDDVPYLDQNAADEQSGMATSRLFNWQRMHDDGIWLDDGTRNIDEIRELQNHAWIADPFHDAGDEAVRDAEPRSQSVEDILRWNNDVQQHHGEPWDG